MREIVKIRKVAGSVVVSLPKILLDGAGISVGDRVLVEVCKPNRLMISPEKAAPTAAEYLKLQIALLERKRAAIEAERRALERKFSEVRKHNDAEQRAHTSAVAEIVSRRSAVDVSISEVTLQLFEVEQDSVSPVA